MNIKNLKDFDGKEILWYYDNEAEIRMEPKKGKYIFHHEATRGEYEWIDRYYIVYLDEQENEISRTGLLPRYSIKWKRKF